MGKACILLLVFCFLCHPKFEVNLLGRVSLFDSDGELQDSCAQLYLCVDMKGFNQPTLKCLQMLCELMSMLMQRLWNSSYFLCHLLRAIWSVS